MISRTIFAVVFLASSALASPPLTSIQDILYKADGSRFNGIVTITWSSFRAADGSLIATQSTTASIVNGSLHVQLVPTDGSVPSTVYSVTYNSDGLFQFHETWAVPASTLPLRVQDVRVGVNSLTSVSSLTTPIEESDVVGLVDDLGVRPLKGPGFAAGRVAFVNATGAIESVAGSTADCVRVDGSAGPCGGGSVSFVDGETLVGIADGSNTQFTLSALPDPPASLTVFRNGVLQKTGQDYTVNAQALTFVFTSVPQAGDTLLAFYRVLADEVTPTQFPSPQVLCSGTGAATNGASLVSIGTCSIPAGLLLPGDRVEVRFDLEHQGPATGFSFEIHWGGTTLAHRDATAPDTLISGRVDAGLLITGAQFSLQTWGAILPFVAGVAFAGDSYNNGLTIDFQGKLGASASGDLLVLRNYAVVRIP